MIREMFLYYYGEHSQDVYNYEIGMGGVGIGTPFVDTSSSLAETIASILDSTPHAIILVQASVNL